MHKYGFYSVGAFFENYLYTGMVEDFLNSSLKLETQGTEIKEFSLLPD